MKREYTPYLCIALSLLTALFSIFVLAKPLSSPETHRETIDYLDQRRTVVLELTGASTAASAAITMAPGDVGTPIAQKLADLSSAFLVILTALVLEKYLVTLTGWVTFTFLIPIACALTALFFLLYRESLLRMAVRLTAVGLLLFFLVPVSVRLSRFIENTYQDYQAALETALNQDEEDLYQEGAASSAVPEASAPETVLPDTAEQGSAEESRQWWQRALDDLTGKAGAAGAVVQQQVEKIRGDMTELVEQVSLAPEKLSRLLNHYIEVVAVLIVTSCLIPALVVLAFYAVLKLTFRMDEGLFSSLLNGK